MLDLHGSFPEPTPLGLGADSGRRLRHGAEEAFAGVDLDFVASWSGSAISPSDKNGKDDKDGEDGSFGGGKDLISRLMNSMDAANTKICSR